MDNLGLLALRGRRRRATFHPVLWARLVGSTETTIYGSSVGRELEQMELEHREMGIIFSTTFGNSALQQENGHR
jgi:hypothetical protein